MLKTNLTLSSVVSLLLLTLSASAQKEISYSEILANSTVPLERFEALDSLISTNRRKNLDNFIDYSLQYIALAKELDSIEAAARKVINISYSLTAIKNEPKEVVRLIDGILARKYKMKDSFLIGSLYLKRGAANARLDLPQAIIDYENAIDNYTSKDSVYVADAYLFSGQTYSNMGKFVPAGENYKKAYEYFEALEDYEYMNYARQGITAMFSMNGFYDKAKEERDFNIKKIKQLGLEHHLPTTYYNQALDYKKMGKPDLYLENLKKADSVINELPPERINPRSKIYVYSKLSAYFSENNNLKESNKYLSLLKDNFKLGSDDLVNKVHHNDAMAHYYLANKDYRNSLEYAERKLANARVLGYEEDILDSYELLAKVYSASGNYKKGLENMDRFSALKDSIYNKTTANTLAYYQTLYETEKKENELIEKSTSIQLLEKDNESAKKRLINMSIILISVFGMIILFRNRMRIKGKKVLQEKFSQELLVSQEEERKRISKDLHDGLGQRLLLIKNKVHRSQDDETKKLVETAIDEVRAISRNLHPFQLQELGITKAIEYTLNQIDENTTLFISSEIDNIDNLFSKKQEVNIYRIVQECLNNIIKHAKAEAGKVVVKREHNVVTVSIRDNGVGFNFTEKYDNIRSLGLKTLLERTKFLNGQMKIQSKKNNGTLLEFQFPVA